MAENDHVRLIIVLGQDFRETMRDLWVGVVLELMGRRRPRIVPEVLVSQSRLHRRALLQGLAAATTFAAPAAADEHEAIAFVALGDWGQRGRRSQHQVAKAPTATAVKVG